jgi:GNAT superfamily N-acetyltransferase
MIRRATSADAPTILALDASLGVVPNRDEMLRASIARGTCFVDDQLVGFAIADRSFFDQMFISLVVVHPSRRRCGIATALVEHIEGLTRGKLFTSTNRSNAPMRALCVRRGFVESGVIENLDDGDPEIIYFKQC